MGKTVNFSSSLIIFTSNIGLLGGSKAMNHGMRVLPGEDYQETERKIVGAIQDHFRYKLERPELLNRIGKNIVVFEFIKGRTSILIFENMLHKILKAVMEERGVEVQFATEALATLQDLCCYDLFEGGRGIGNRLEAEFVNPLARLLFENNMQPGTTVMIEAVKHTGDETTLII
jgi:ATP-dependent Clp protease ATP-binding subunit ClpA